MTMEKAFKDRVGTKESVERREFPEIFLTHLLWHGAEKMAEGANGIILRLRGGTKADQMSDQEDWDEIEGWIDTGLAAKIIKVFTADAAGRREFAALTRAYSVVDDASVKSEKPLAMIPTPLLYRDISLDQDLAAKLKNYGASVSRHAEVLLMEYVHGEDLATMLYRAMLKMHPKTEYLASHNLDEWTFEELHSEVSRQFFVAPVAKQNAEEQRALRDKLDAKNAHYLISELARIGYSVDSRIIEQIRNTLEVFHAAGVAHRDLHPRNIMVTQGENGPQVYIIDFGTALVQDRPIAPADFIDDATGVPFADDFATVRLLEDLNRRSVERAPKIELTREEKLLKNIKAKARAFRFGTEAELGLIESRNNKSRNRASSLAQAIEDEIKQLDGDTGAQFSVGSIKKRATAIYKNTIGVSSAVKVFQGTDEWKKKPENMLYDQNALLTAILFKIYEAYETGHVSLERITEIAHVLSKSEEFSAILHDVLSPWNETSLPQELPALFSSTKEKRAAGQS